MQGDIATELQKANPDFGFVTDQMNEIAKIPASDNYQITMNDKVTPKASLQAFVSNPIGVIGELMGESIGTMARTGKEYAHKVPEKMAQFTAAGAVAGTLAAGPAGGVAGGAGGASVGFATGMAEAGSLGSYAAEYSGSILDSMQEVGINTKDPKSLEKAWNDKEKMAEFRAKAEKKAVPIAFLDGLSFAFGGKIFAQPAKKLGGKALQWGAELGLQMGLGGGGEVLGQLWSEGEITSVRSVMAEVVAEVPGGIGEVGIGRLQQAFQNRGMDERKAKDMATRLAAAIREAQANKPAPPVEVPGAPPAPTPSAAAPEVTTKPTAPAEPAPEFGPVAGPVRSSLEKNLPEESKGEAADLTNAATAYMQDHDAAAAGLEGDPEQSRKAHEAALKNVPAKFKKAFQMLPANAMDADPATFGEWLAESYSGTRPATPEAPQKSVAEMIRDAKVRVETAESQKAVEDLAAPAEPEAAPAETEGPTSPEEVEALVKEYQDLADEKVISGRKPRGQRKVNVAARNKIIDVVARSRAFRNLPREKQRSVVNQMYAIADMVGDQFEKFGITYEVRPEDVDAAGVAYDRRGNLFFYINPEELHQNEQEAQESGAPKGLLSRITNGEELIHAADLTAQVAEWKKNPFGRDFFAYRRDETAKLLKDIRKSFDKTKDKKTRDRLYQSLLDQYNIYFGGITRPRPDAFKSGEDLLTRMETLVQSNIHAAYGRPISWMAEFVRAAKQMEKQGMISEGVMNEFFQGVQNWLHRALRRITRALPGVRDGAYGKVLQDRLQRIDDVLADKDVESSLYEPRGVPSEETGPAVVAEPRQGELSLDERKKNENGPFPLNAAEPKTIINIGMHIEGDGDITENQVWDALNKNGVKVKVSDVKESTYVDPKGETVTERVFVAELEKAMDEDTAYSVSVDTKQDAIGQRTGASGELYGPKAAEWRPFNEDFFQSEILFRMSTEKLTEIAKNWESFKDWYDRIDAAFDEILGEYKEYAPLIKDLLASMSVLEGVKSNVTKMVPVLKEFIETGMVAKKSAEGKTLMKAKYDNILRTLRGEELHGPKVAPFSAALHGVTTEMAIDRHVANVLFGTKKPTPKQIKLAKERIAQIATRLGWTNRQVQSALWAANEKPKGREGARYEDSIRAKQEEIRSILSRDITGRGREASRRIAERVEQRGSVEAGAEPVAVEGRKARGNVPTGTQAVSPQSTAARRNRRKSRRSSSRRSSQRLRETLFRDSSNPRQGSGTQASRRCHSHSHRQEA